MFLVTVLNTAFRSILSSGDILIVVSVSRFASADLSVSIIIWNKCCTASILGCSAPALFQISYLQINCGVKLCLLVSFSTKFVIYAQTNKWKWQRDLRIYVALRTFLSNCKSRNGVVICECFLLYRRVVETTTDATKAHRWKKAYQSTTETFSLMSICKAYLISRLLLCGPVWIMAPACITFLWFKKKKKWENHYEDALRDKTLLDLTLNFRPTCQANADYLESSIKCCQSEFLWWCFRGMLENRYFITSFEKSSTVSCFLRDACNHGKIAGVETCPWKLQPSQRCSLHPVLI